MPFVHRMEYTIDQWLDRYLRCRLYLPASSNGRPGTSFLHSCSVEHIADKNSIFDASKNIGYTYSHRVIIEVPGLPFDYATKLIIVFNI